MTPKFTRTTIPEKESLGEKLSKKRAALGFDVKEAERATKIRARHIEALESGDWSKLPPDVYVRGFLKNYAAFLKLDESKVTRLYLKERGLAESVKRATAPIKETPKARFKAPQVLITPQKIAVSSAVILGLSVLFYIGFQFAQIFKNPEITIASPSDNTQVSEDNVVIEGTTEAGNKVFINGFEISPTPEGNFKEKISLQEGTNLISITAKSRLEKESTTEITVISRPAQITINQTEASDLLAKLDIGPNPTSLFIEVDDKPISEKAVLMLPGSSQTVRAKTKIVISASDGGSVRISLNNKDLGPLGGPGEKVTRKELTTAN